MRRALFVMFGFAITPAHAQSVGLSPTITLPQILARMQNVNAGTHTLAGDFARTYRTARFNTVTQSAGHVLAAASGSDWLFTSPSGFEAAANGAHECFYNASENTLYKRDTSESLFAAAAQLLVDSTATASFTFTLMSAPVPAANGYSLEARPVKATLTFDKALILLNPHTFEIVRVVFVDFQGNRDMFEFTGVRRNVPLVRAFSIHAPATASFVALASGSTVLPASCP